MLRDQLPQWPDHGRGLAEPQVRPGPLQVDLQALLGQDLAGTQHPVTAQTRQRRSAPEPDRLVQGLASLPVVDLAVLGMPDKAAEPVQVDLVPFDIQQVTAGRMRHLRRPSVAVGDLRQHPT